MEYQIAQVALEKIKNANGAGLVEYLQVTFPKAHAPQLLTGLEIAETELHVMAANANTRKRERELQGLTRRLIGAQGVVREQAHAMRERKGRNPS